MKKLVAILLLAVMCLSLFSCAGIFGKGKSIIGTWVYPKANSVLVINDDNTGNVTVGDDLMYFTWVYDKDTKIAVFTLKDSDETEQGIYMADNDVINLDGWLYTRAD